MLLARLPNGMRTNTIFKPRMMKREAAARRRKKIIGCRDSDDRHVYLWFPVQRAMRVLRLAIFLSCFDQVLFRFNILIWPGPPASTPDGVVCVCVCARASETQNIYGMRFGRSQSSPAINCNRRNPGRATCIRIFDAKKKHSIIYCRKAYYYSICSRQMCIL